MTDEKTAPNQEMFSIKEVAAKVGLSYITVFRAVRDGKLKTDRFGQQHRITQAQIDAWGSARA